MAQVSRANSKLKFQTADIPTQADFEDLHDSAMWYDEGGGGGGKDSISIYQALGSTIKAEPPYHILNITTSANLLDNRIVGVPVLLPTAETLTGVRWYQVNQGAYVADNENGVALYSYDNGTNVCTLRASSTNDGDIWKAPGFEWGTKAFTSTYAAAAGLYFIAILYNNSSQTTGPSLGVSTAVNSAVLSGLFTTNAKIVFSISAQNTFPSSFNMSATIASSTSLFYLAAY